MKRSNRFLFREAIAALKPIAAPTIVVGAIRSRGARETDGHSTLRWPASATIWSVDNDPAAVTITRDLRADRSNRLCVLADALAFLQTFSTTIELLYLDGPHPDHNDGRRWHLDAFQAASLAEHSVLLIDDTDLSKLGKAELVVPAARDTGFQLVAGGRQTLMVR